MSFDTTDENVLALATEFVNQNNPQGWQRCVATEVIDQGNGQVNIIYGAGHEWSAHLLELCAFGWNNPKK